MNEMNLKNRPKILLLRLSPGIYKHSHHPIGHRPPYTLKYIEALLRQDRHCEVRFIDQRVSKLSVTDIEKDMKQWGPQYVVFDISSLNLDISIKFCENMTPKSPSAKIISLCVGQSPSADIRTFKRQYRQFDFALAGEAELEIHKILQCLYQGRSVENIQHMYQQEGTADRLWTVEDPDQMPFPEYDGESLKGYSFVYPLRMAQRIIWGHMLSSRGCPHQCVFCSQIMRESYGRRVRLRSASSVVDEMEHLLASGANVISFDDDNFTSSPQHVQSICEEILRRKLKIRWIAHARIDEINADLLKLMGHSGCVLLRYGIETASERILHVLHKTRETSLWLKKAREAVLLSRQNGISVACLFMIGCPSETQEELKQTIRFAQDINPDIIQVAYFTPFPGSHYYKIFRETFSRYNVTQLYHYSIPSINLSHMTEREFRSAQKSFYKSFLLRPAFIINHFRKYTFFYMANPDVFLKLIKVKKLTQQRGPLSPEAGCFEKTPGRSPAVCQELKEQP